MNREAPHPDFSTFDASLNQQAQVENPHSIEEQNNARLRHKVRELFQEQFLPGGETSDDWGHGAFGADDKILDLIEAPFGEERRYTKDQRERVRMFFDELVAYTKEQRRDPEQREELLGYLSQWRESAFSVSPNISNFLTMNDELVVAAELNSIPELRRTISSAVGGELVYNLQYMRGSRKEFLQDVLTSATPEQKLKLIDYMINMGADARGQGWADEAADDINDVLKELCDDEHASPFVHYAARVALEQLADHEDNMGSFFWAKADEEERERVLQNISPDDASFVEKHFAQLSKDAVGSFDHQGTLQSLAKVEAGAFVHDPDVVSAHDLETGLSLLNTIQQGDGRGTLRLMDFFESQIFHRRDSSVMSDWREMIGGGVDEKILARLERDKKAMDDVLKDWAAFQQETKEGMEAEGHSWDEIREELDASRWEYDQQLIAPFDDIQAITQMLSTKPEFFQRLQAHLEGLNASVKTQEVHFDLVDDLPTRTDLFPKGGVNGMNTVDLLQVMQRPAFRRELEADLGVSLNELTLREQTQMLGYLASVDSKTAKDAFGAIQAFGVDAARAFLSCEMDKGNGQVILQIARTLNQETAAEIFSRYSEIAELAQTNAQELVDQVFEKGKGASIDQAQIEGELLKRAKDVLVQFGRGGMDPKEIESRLARANADTILFASIFKTAFKGGKEAVDWSKMKGLEFGSRSAVEILDSEKQEMIDIAKENWLMQKESVANYIINGLEKKLESTNEGSEFFVLKKDGRVAAFIRFDKREDLGSGATYAGSLNVRFDLRGSAVGEAMLARTIEQKANVAPVYADVFPELIAGTNYVEHSGAVIYGIEDVVVDEQGNTESRLLIRWDQQTNPQYKTRAQGVDSGRASQMGGIETIQGNVGENKTHFVEAIREASKRGFVGTRYFADKKNPAVRYVVLEPELKMEELLAAK